MLRLPHRILRTLFLLTAVAAVVPTSSSGQYKTKKEPVSPRLTIKPSDVEYQLWEGFMLVRKANDGDPFAQHELGIRHLIGKGFSADTALAFFWIHKAADQNFRLANYNLGIFYTNGWGVDWNPFQAYRHFRASAERGFPDAQFAIAATLTENLVVPRDLDEAYRWMKRAADGNFEPAKEALPRLEKQIAKENADTASTGDTGGDDAPPDSTIGKSAEFLFLDLETDTMSHMEDPALLDSLLTVEGTDLRSLVGVTPEKRETAQTAEPASDIIRDAANVGSPEARILLGRCYESGRGCVQDNVKAALEYLSAIRVDSPKGPELLWNLTRNSDVLSQLEPRSKRGDLDARFVWAGLIAMRFDNRLTEEQSVQFLTSGAERNHIESLLELGVRYSSGRTVPQDREKGLSLWKRAADLGSKEAQARLALSDVLSQEPDAVQRSLPILSSLSREGSVLAQVALGYCFEKGIGKRMNKGEASRWYRRAARRGNEGAYLSLRHMHDELRPADPQFQIPD